MEHIDCHVHLERGPYTLDWVKKFVETAVSHSVTEMWLLEHCYRFHEFVPMYRTLRAHSGDSLRSWLDRKCGVLPLSDYLALCADIRRTSFPIRIRTGLEICWFSGSEDFLRPLLREAGLDFYVGSVHYIDSFAFDHADKIELWNAVDTDWAYHRFFELSCELASSGLFDGIAHPDSIKLFGHRPSFPLMAEYDKLASILSAQNMYAEHNSGISRRTNAEPGMAPALLDAMRRHHVRILTASDAHTPADVGLLTFP